MWPKADLKPFGRPKHFSKLPTTLEPTFFDYKQALKVAKANNRMLFVNFTGHGCVGDTRQLFWPSEYFIPKTFIENKLVYCALYVDDKTVLADSSDWFISKSGKIQKSIGALNGRIQERTYDSNAQPLYALIDPHTDSTLCTFYYSSPTGKTLNLIKGYYGIK